MRYHCGPLAGHDRSRLPPSRRRDAKAPAVTLLTCCGVANWPPALTRHRSRCGRVECLRFMRCKFLVGWYRPFGRPSMSPSSGDDASRIPVIHNPARPENHAVWASKREKEFLSGPFSSLTPEVARNDVCQGGNGEPSIPEDAWWRRLTAPWPPATMRNAAVTGREPSRSVLRDTTMILDGHNTVKPPRIGG